MELYMNASAPSDGSSSNNPGTSSSILRVLDELLMGGNEGGNDLDALQFEFGCDFEDKYHVVPQNAMPVPSSSPLPSTTSSVSDAGNDMLPSLSAALLSPSLNFHLWAPSPSFRMHSEHDRIKPSQYQNVANHHRPLKRDCDGAFPVPTSHIEPAKNVKETAYSVAPGTEDDLSLTTSTHIGRWTKKEHELFLEGLKLYGKSWKKISSLVTTRTLVQIRTHAQKYLQKQNKHAQKALAAANAAAASATKMVSRQQQDAWKGTRGLVPISFPDILSASSSASTSSSSLSSSSSSFSRSSSPYILPAIVKKESSASAMCKLDQLLQDEPHGTPMDGYYQSPIGSDEEIIQPVYVGGGQWSREESHSAAASSSSQQIKRRRLEPLAPGSSSQLVNPMEAMASSADAHLGMFGAGNNCFSSSDFHHLQLQQQLNLYTPANHFVDSEYTYGSWQLP